MKTLTILLSAIALTSLSHAQQGYSSGTMGMLQSEYYNKFISGNDLSKDEKEYYRNGALEYLLPNRIVPEEILNYHRHVISLPAQGSKVTFSPELTNHPLLQNHYMLQLGLATDTVLPDNRNATGVMYVLDISGSMGGEARLERAKEAIIASLERMNPNDYFGVTIFDDRAEILIPYGRFGNRKEEINERIHSLNPRGGTDILKGLDLAIDEMMRTAYPPHAKSILLLTDGNTNVGVTERGALIAEYQKKSNNEIRVTTLGIGIDLKQDLMRDLSESTHGQFHFIERAEDIQKTCVNEFGSMAYPIGKNVMLSVVIPSYFTVKQVYGGSNWKIEKGVLQIPLQDINYFLTQVAIIDLELTSDIAINVADLKSTLSYTDYDNDKPVIINQAAIQVTENEKVLYNDLMKNYLIAQWSVDLKSLSETYRADKDVEKMKENLATLMSNPVAAYNYLEKDADVLRLKTVFEKVSTLL